MTEAEYMATVEGWKLRHGMEEAIIRKLAYVVASSAGAKVNSEKALWKIPAIDDVPGDERMRQLEVLRAKVRERAERLKAG